MFDIIYNDKNIIKRYKDIEMYEDNCGNWAYHNLDHINNVINIVERLLLDLGYDEEFIINAKIAALLHDVGCIEGKKDHAYKSYLYAKEYLKNIKLKYKNEVLEAIKIHSDGFYSNNVIASVLILADKLDMSYERVTKEGIKVIGNRQYHFVNKIDVNIHNKKLIVNYIIRDDCNLKELEDYYFTLKMFDAIRSFSNKFKLEPIVLLNNKIWNKFIERGN